ncbi:TraR/DksA family transcriptional regulator [Aquihabitans daechungensis]|uniref:TraR/DksA family transcriptional regulator n=1 Tax=Aquihabitans daechungensis TaxID=1052257 RepID=UPI003B9EC988
MPQPDLTAVRDQLDSERADLARQLQELTSDGAAADADENFADTAQVAAELVENRTLAATLQDQLDDVETALARIDAGSYGACEVCEKPITAARLEAMPSTRFCIDHA